MPPEDIDREVKNVMQNSLADAVKDRLRAKARSFGTRVLRGHRDADPPRETPDDEPDPRKDKS